MRPSPTEKRKRDALPFFSPKAAIFGAAVIITLQPAAAQSQTEPLPPVLRQHYDDDCGLAALQMLLQRAGIAATEAVLLAGLPPGADVDALTAADLVAMVAALQGDVQLEVGYLPLATVAALAGSEPFLILMQPDALTGFAGFDHFILVEGRQGGDFIVADPVLPSQVRLSDTRFADQVHGRTVNGQPHAMILRLTRKGEGAAPPLPVVEPAPALQSWEQAYRFPRLLPPGKVELALLQIRQRDRATDPATGLRSGGVSDISLLSIAAGVGSRSQVGLNVAAISGTGGFNLPGETFEFDRDGSFNAALTIDHIPAFALPPSLALVTYATVEWSDKVTPSAAALGGTLLWTNGALAAGVEGDVRYDGRLTALVTPTIAYRMPAAGFVLEAELAAPYRLGSDRPRYEIQFSANRSFGLDWQIGAFFSTSLLGPRGERVQQFGLGLTYGIPRRLRRR